MATTICTETFDSWFSGALALDGAPFSLSQFFNGSTLGAATPPSPPPVPDIALNPRRPNELQAQAGQVVISRFSGLEHGSRTQTNAIVLHMTGGSAASTLANYANTSIGAHFLIKRDGTIVQTAGLDQIAYHVGNPRPKGFVPTPAGGNRRVDADLLPAAEAILDRMQAGTMSFGEGIRALAALERIKPYGEDRADETTRGPINSDSIGIEFEAVPVNDVYPALTDAQRASGQALLDLLKTHYGLDAADVYEHPDVSYKNYTEARGAKEQIESYGAR